jgi:hypothetical protein
LLALSVLDSMLPGIEIACVLSMMAMLSHFRAFPRRHAALQTWALQAFL